MEIAIATEHGHREFAKQPSDDAAHHQKRNEDGDERKAHGENRRADLARAAQCGSERLHALLQITRDVFDHYDGVVYHEAAGNGQGPEREVVQAIPEEIHHAEGGDQGYRNRNARNEGGAAASQK